MYAATIWGIAVICTRCAVTAPTTEPRAVASRIRSSPWNSMTNSVAIRAITMPKAAMVLPERAVSGRRRRRMPTMNSAAASRYARKVAACTR